jgi:monothiol glutaredoxin
MDASTKQRIEELIASSPIVVFMKGSKLMPQCGFSNNVVQIGGSDILIEMYNSGELREALEVALAS